MAPLKGGGDNSELRPLDLGDERMGFHKGSYEALNIRNPQPGWRYKYESTGGRGSFVQKALNDGYVFVLDSHPEKWGVPEVDMPPRVQAAMDSIRAFQDVVLMKTPVENWERLEKENEELWLSQQGRADDSFMGAGEENAAAAGAAAKGKPLHHRTPEHRIGFIEEDR